MRVEIRKMYRGFWPHKDGEDEIIVNDKKIKGAWQYWDVFGNVYSEVGKSIPVLDLDTDILQETICQGVHKVGEMEIFEGDIVKDNRGNVYEVIYENMTWKAAEIIADSSYICDFFYLANTVEVIGNKWQQPKL